MTSAPDPRPRQIRQRRSRNRAADRDKGPTILTPDTPPAEVFLAIGQIVAAHGIRGEVKMAILTDRPERVPDLRRVYFNDDPTPVPLASARLHSRHILLKFPHIDTRTEAEALKGTIIRVSPSQLPPLEEDTFYHFQIINLAVFDESGALLGWVAEILDAGEVDVYVVRDDAGTEYMFPALKSVVLEINPAAGRVVVRPQVWEE